MMQVRIPGKGVGIVIAIGICEDSPEDLRRLQEALERLVPEVCGEPARCTAYRCGEALLADLEEEGADFALLFLDIFMGGITGIDTARRLRELGRSTPLVFLTTSPDFAVESYDVEAAGYLLKPLREEKLAWLLRRLLERETQLPVALPVGRGSVYLSRREILYAESMAYKLKIHRAGAEPLEVRWKLDELEALLRDPRFLRCHQSYLVNLDHVARAERDFLLKDGTWIPIRVRSRRQILDAYHRYFLSKF